MEYLLIDCRNNCTFYQALLSFELVYITLRPIRRFNEKFLFLCVIYSNNELKIKFKLK